MSDYKMYVWRMQPTFTAMAHARSVEEARRLVLEDSGSPGDESTPMRKLGIDFVMERNPEIFQREVAEFVLTDSAELQEMEEYCQVLSERLRELTGTAGVTLEQFKASKASKAALRGCQ